MGYRMKDRPPKPEDHLPRFAIRNGATFKTRFVCYYFTPKKRHDPLYHDHVGWPEPKRPDDSCQMLPPRYPIVGFPRPVIRTKDDLTPIKLQDEGYSGITVSVDEEYSEFLNAEAVLDEDDSIRIFISTAFPEFKDKPIDVRFTVYAHNPTEHLIDEVCHAILSVLPANPGNPGDVS